MTDVTSQEVDRPALPGRDATRSGPSLDRESPTDEIVVTAGRGGRRYIQDLWHYRELFVFLAWRDILIRYKQTVVGIAWSAIRPLLTMVVLVFVFGKLGNMPSGGVPYPLLVFCGLLPWQFFSVAVAACGESLVGNAALVSKVYFPRLIVPIGSLAVSVVDFAISLAILVGLMFWYAWLPPITVLWLPLFALLAVAIAFGVGVWVAALMVEYRDVRYIIPFALQLGLYISPVGFSSNVVPEQYQFLYALNPMVGVIEGFRACLLGGQHTIDAFSVIVSIIGAVVLVTTGLAYFRSNERKFADVI